MAVDIMQQILYIQIFSGEEVAYEIYKDNTIFSYIVIKYI